MAVFHTAIFRRGAVSHLTMERPYEQVLTLCGRKVSRHDAVVLAGDDREGLGYRLCRQCSQIKETTTERTT